MPKDQIVEYHLLQLCPYCEEEVECKLYSWVEKIALLTEFNQDSVKVRVEVSAKCPNCSRVLGRGAGVIELH